MGDREGDHRAEGVGTDQKFEVLRDHEGGRDDPGEADEDERRRAAGMQAAEPRWYLALRGERVGEAREPEHRGVGRRHQRHGRERGDGVKQDLLQPVRVHLLDDTDHRRVAVRRAKRRDAVAHGQRADRDDRDADVDEGHCRRRGGDESLQTGPTDANLPGEPGRRLKARERDHRNRRREEQTGPSRGRAEMDGRENLVGFEEHHEADHDDQGLQREVPGQKDADAQRAARAEAADVQEHNERYDAQREGQRGSFFGERRPERPGVLGCGERRDGDQDRVVEQDRPAGREADQLVERVTREDGRAAALLVQGCRLDVRHGRQRVHTGGDQEDERRETQGVPATTPSVK